MRRKRLVGGTSWLTRFTPRGCPGDYDEWAALGNEGWGWEEVLPYFTRLETDADFGDQPWHGDRGPIPSTRYLDLEYSEIVAAGVEALQEVGFAVVDDHNCPGAVGVGRMPMNSRGGQRVTTADAYLPLGQTPPNLTIRADALVDRVLFEGPAARGVRLVDGSEIEAGWVVLCAGTYGSPSILIRSGIGPAAHLRELGIPLLADLPGVGENLVDHPGVYLDCGYPGAGRSAPVLHAIATFHSSGCPGEEPPDLMFWFGDPTGPAGEPEQFVVEVILLKPRSHGHVRLRSSDPAEAPAIELPGLNDPTDLERLAEGYRRALDVINRPEIRRLCPGPKPTEPEGGELAKRIRQERYSVPHVIGTCAMGLEPDNGAVVDPLGRVHTTERLSIIDASIMPTIPSGFPHIPTIMIAELLSEQIVHQL